ncbi:MAG: UDP-N-acetylmuramate--L-alanine ligase [Bdellovibrionales bacterium]|nr:UDP-N-acetylmuramate--L-alanine ligase [Bdellovibrionales bacterium]
MTGSKPRGGDKPLHLHFIAIGGIGMSGVAEVFFNQGYSVSGSDISESETTKHLREIGIDVAIGHRAENVREASVVVYSSAVRKDNPEMVEARRLGIPVIPRAEALGELMRGKIGIALAGTHGKTTTTTLVATILAEAGLDPTILVGGKVDAFGGNARLGQGEYVVAEADESDGSFLFLPAVYGAITNIDADHLDHYGDLAKIDDAFCAFAARIPFFGKVYVCGDDAGVRRNLPRFSKPYATYGLDETNHLRATNLESTERGTSFDVEDAEAGKLGRIDLGTHGLHNVRNALAAVGLSVTLGVPFEKIRSGLAKFRGVRRRFDLRYEDAKRGVRILDDYGHHPTEIAATVEAARSLLGRSARKGRLLLAFQPHRYTRTQHSAAEFAECFGGSDRLYLTEIYAAGEDPIPGIDGKFLADRVSKAKSRPPELLFEKSLEDCATRIVSDLRDGDLVLCMGAGSVTKLPDLIVSRLGG